MTTYNVIVLGSVMLLTGSLGGLANHLLAQKDDPQGSNIWRSWLLGVVAAMLVPLFLKLISSDVIANLINITPGTRIPFDLLVFAGMCLVAAVSSKAFIQTLSARVLQEVKEAKQQAQQATEKVDNVTANIEPMVVRQTEHDPSAEVAALAPNANLLDEENKGVLLAFSKRSFILRTRSGLTMDAGIDKSKIDQVLAHLVELGLVGVRTLDHDKQRWFITESGQRMAAAIALGIEPSGSSGPERPGPSG